MPVTDICREHGIYRATYYKWKAKIWGHGYLRAETSEETGNRKLKQAT
jgi:transposase-like protein